MLGSLNAARVDLLDGEEWNVRMTCVAEEDAERWGNENKRLPEEVAILNLVNLVRERKNHTNSLPFKPGDHDSFTRDTTSKANTRRDTPAAHRQAF
jgi:hypothetical protein